MAFNPNQQASLVLDNFDPAKMLGASLNTRAPWDSIVDFATHDSYCGLELFPRQATLLKLIFLETDNMTAYDVEVIEEWREGMKRVRDVYGVQPDIWERVEYLKARGYRRFPHIQAVLGRRASKGFIGGILGCEQIAFLHSLDDPQNRYGIAANKDVYLNVGATSQTVAMRQMFADIRTAVEGCKYFRPDGKPPWIAESKDHILRVRTPADLRRIAGLRAARVPVDHLIATLCGVALSASSVAGRGATSFGNVYDEFAFHVQTGSVKSDTQIYKDWQPSLGQFGKDSLTYIPSSPATRVGMFHTLYQQGKILLSTYNDSSNMGEEARQTLVNNGITMELDSEPTWLIFQGPSWGLYEDWERTPEILGLGYGFPKAPEPDLSDERQIRERRRDPEKFQVEKEGQFAEVQGAYLDKDKVDAMFRRPSMGTDEDGKPIYWRDALEPQAFGTFDRTYRMHCDPGLSGANFAMAIGHLEDAPPDEHGRVWPHVVFDLLKVWRPMDAPVDPDTGKQYIDYVQVHDDLDDVIGRFMSLKKVTFDQWQSQSFIAQLKKKFSPGIMVGESTFSEKVNQFRMGQFKSALNLGWVHSYTDNFYYDDLSCLLELELKYLAMAPNGKIVKQDVGPVVTKDLADCYRDDVEVLTEHGWKLFADVDGDERVATRREDGVLEYQLPTDRVARHYQGDLLVSDEGYFDFAVTPGHRMLGTDFRKGRHRFVTAEELENSTSSLPVPRMSRVSDRTPGVLSFESRTGGLCRVDHDRNAGRSRWTADQDSWLQENYVTASMVDLCATLGRTRSTIYNRAKALGLHRGQLGERLRGNGPTLPDTKTIDFARYLGFWLAEGRKMRGKPGNSATVTQTKPEGIEWADAMFSRLGWPVQRTLRGNGETAWTVRSRELKDWLLRCQGDGHELLIPDEVFSTWTAEEMAALLEGLLVGDGVWHGQNGRHSAYLTTSRRLADDVQRLLAHVGGVTGRIRERTRPADHPYRANHTLWAVDLSYDKVNRLHPRDLRRENYDGMVYCLTVPNSTLLTRRHGVALWAGNCVMEVTVDLLHHALESYSKGTRLSVGSSDVAALRSGQDIERSNEQQVVRRAQGSAASQMTAAAADKLRAQMQGRSRKGYQPDRRSSIHQRKNR